MTERPKQISKVLVDGDVMVYRSAFATQDKPPWETEDSLDQLLNYVVEETVSFPSDNNFKVYLTGKGNFRNDIARAAEYKGNRRDTTKPTHYLHAREYLIDKWGAIVVNGIEADDAIATEFMTGDADSTVIVSVDKDFDTIPCWRFNFTNKTWVQNTPESAIKFFYEQVLTGDRVDNISGIHGIGPKKAQKILEGSTSENELFQKCIEAYNGDVDRVIENCQLLHLRRYDGELWSPPDDDKT